MRLQRLQFMGMLLVLTTCVGTSAIAQTENVNSAPQLPQQYAATAFGQSGGLNGKSIGISLYITQWTSDEDVQAYHATLNKDGSNGLVKALYKSPESVDSRQPDSLALLFASRGTRQRQEGGFTS